MDKLGLAIEVCVGNFYGSYRATGQTVHEIFVRDTPNAFRPLMSIVHDPDAGLKHGKKQVTCSFSTLLLFNL